MDINIPHNTNRRRADSSVSSITESSNTTKKSTKKKATKAPTHNAWLDRFGGVNIKGISGGIQIKVNDVITYTKKDDTVITAMVYDIPISKKTSLSNVPTPCLIKNNKIVVVNIHIDGIDPENEEHQLLEGSDTDNALMHHITFKGIRDYFKENNHTLTTKIDINDITGLVQQASGLEDTCMECGGCVESAIHGCRRIEICTGEGCCLGFHVTCLPKKFQNDAVNNNKWKCPKCTDSIFMPQDVQDVQNDNLQVLFEKIGEQIYVPDGIDSKTQTFIQEKDKELLTFFPPPLLKVRLCLLLMRSNELNTNDNNDIEEQEQEVGSIENEPMDIDVGNDNSNAQAKKVTYEISQSKSGVKRMEINLVSLGSIDLQLADYETKFISVSDATLNVFISFEEESTQRRRLPCGGMEDISDHDNIALCNRGTDDQMVSILLMGGGFEAGKEAGKEEGYAEGHEEGYAKGHEAGKKEGHAEGLKVGRKQGNNEAINEMESRMSELMSELKM